MPVKSTFFLVLMIVTFHASGQKEIQKQVKTSVIGKVWTEEMANTWYAKHEWITGANFLPSTAINQLEMWQAESFDTATINKELGWAEEIGFNTMRVYLHSLAWKQDPEGFKKRMDQYLSIADKHRIHTIFVFFDDCWNPLPQVGKQPIQKLGIHNSGWVQDPGQPLSNDTTLFPFLGKYLKDVMSRFSKDKRILLWDLYNEPGNSGKRDSSMSLLVKAFQWAREVNPEQPISAGLWAWDFEKLNAFQLQNSDILTYHNYEDPLWHQRTIELLKIYKRPMICTEYMARTRNSRFYNILPLLKKHNIGAINWGFVSGKSNTIYAWDTPIPDGSQPTEWFHDIFFSDGKPYSQGEINMIKKSNSERKKVSQN